MGFKSDGGRITYIKHIVLTVDGVHQAPSDEPITSLVNALATVLRVALRWFAPTS